MDRLGRQGAGVHVVVRRHLCEASDGWWHLDTIFGELTLCGRDGAEVKNKLATEDGEEEYLHATFARGGERRGITLQENEVYAFNPHPIIGGPFDCDNLVTLPFVVAHTIFGQLHEQSADDADDEDDENDEHGED